MYKRGNNWVTDFWNEGIRYKKSWGPISKTVAREKEQKFKTEVREGKHQKKTKRILFETFSEKYLAVAWTDKKPSSARRNEVSINMLMPHFKGKLISAIHPFMVEQYKKIRRESGTEPATVNRDVATLRNMMSLAVGWGYLLKNPLDGVKKFKEDNEKMWVLTPDEETKLLTECEKRKQKRTYLKDLVQLALNTGMRRKELFNLKKIDVKLKSRFLIATDTKNHESRNVPLNDTAYSILKIRLKGDTEYVFSNAGNGKLTVLTNAFWNTIKDVGLVRYETAKDGKEKKIRFRFHDLRHTFGSRLGMAGYDLKTIMEIMGHKDPRTAMRYQHPAPSHKLNAVKSLDQITPKVTPSNIVDLKRKANQ
jgi:integrase